VPAGDGKEFESELGKAFKPLESWNHSSNSKTPACDRLGCIQARTPEGYLVGLSVMIEAKECRSDTFELTRIETNERKQLDSHYFSGGGISIVAIKWVTNRPRAFWCHWEDWLEIESGIGFKVELDKGERRARGSASISLHDQFRPGTLHEFGKIERALSLGSVWDLRPILPEGFEAISK